MLDAALLESYSATAGGSWAESCPACLLIQRPACTLEHWLSNARAEATTPAWTDKASLASPPFAPCQHDAVLCYSLPSQVTECMAMHEYMIKFQDERVQELHS